MYILLVDNNRSFVAKLQAMLLTEGFVCIEFTDNGLECLSRIHMKSSPDVIIIDENQCFIQGLDIIENIHEWKPETRIIILTGADSKINIDLLPDKKSIFLMQKSSVNADNLPQVLYNIFTEKISTTRIPPVNKVYSSLRRAFTGMLN